MTEAAPKRSLPRRDWIVLPMLALVTVLVMACLAEGITRVVWPETGVDACIMASDGEKPKANCSGLSKSAEGPWVETRYNLH